MERVISVKHLRKTFKNHTALKDLTFQVKQGEIFGFLGPSGAGKTTTIKILTSQLLPTSGEAKMFGKDVVWQQPEIFHNIGILTDTSGLYERLTARDNLKLFAEITGTAHEAVDEVLDKVGLLAAAKLEARKMSRGMKQRLMIARAIMHKPKLLFLDEPTSSLDPGTVLDIHRLLRQLNEEGTTIFLTTHNMEEADKLCDTVAFLNDGEIVDIGPPQLLKLKYTDNKIKVILRDNQVLTVENDAVGSGKIYQCMNEGQLVAIHSQEPNLEQIFLKLTGREL